MSKKDNKRKTNKVLTKNKKEAIQDPTASKLNQQMDQSSNYNNKFRKKS